MRRSDGDYNVRVPEILDSSVIEKIHRYALIGLLASIPLGILVSAAFYDGHVEPAVRIWFLCLGFYLPIYVCRSEFRGVIAAKFSEVKREENPVGFRVVQAIYIIFSVFIFLAAVRFLP